MSVDSYDALINTNLLKLNYHTMNLEIGLLRLVAIQNAFYISVA